MMNPPRTAFRGAHPSDDHAPDNRPALARPLVARCPTLIEATSTVEYLRDHGVPGRALSVVAGAGYYVVSDRCNARTARRLLRTGADAQAPGFEGRSTPCVGSLNVGTEPPGEGPDRAGRRLRFRRRFTAH